MSPISPGTAPVRRAPPVSTLGGGVAGALAAGPRDALRVGELDQVEKRERVQEPPGLLFLPWQQLGADRGGYSPV